MSTASKHDGPETVQFGMRAALAALTVSAVAFAIAAPFIRALTPSQRARLLAVVGTFIFGAGGMVVSNLLLRRRASRRAGAVLIEAPLTTIRSMRGLIISTLFNCAYVLWMAGQIVIIDGPWWTPVLALLFCVTGGFQATMAILQLVWRKAMVSIAFCENGLVVNAIQYQPWKVLAGCRWDFERGYIWYPKSKYYANGYKLPPELRDAADRIMRDNVPPPAETKRPL